MAILPEQVNVKSRQLELDQLNKVEAFIDAEIQKEKNKGKALITISLNKFAFLKTESMFEELKQRYLAVGWKTLYLKVDNRAEAITLTISK
ncbi:MAG: hypothetical protein EBU90_01680 [Proteobacteria bacterium]|nr:hypothetical protein [Pseudomonadota bacterium]